MLQKYSVAIFAVVFLLAREGSSQCFTNADCTGGQVPADNRRECCIMTNTGLSYNDGGTCTECIVHGFVQAVYTVMEEERLDTRFELNVKGTTNFPGLLNIQGTITSVAGGTATDSDFGNLLPIDFTNEVNIRLFTTNDDTTLEYNEYVTLTFTPANPALISGLEGEGEYVRTSAIVNIIDNDRLEINFEESDYSVTEGAGLTTPITLQFRNNQNAFNITFSPVTIDAVEGKGLGANFINSETIEEESRAEIADFSDLPITIEIPAATDDGAQEFELPNFFLVNDDDIDEIEQSFAIVAEFGPDVTEVPFNFSCFQLQAGETECFGRRGATEIRITDNDPMIIGFTTRSRTVSEGDAPEGSDVNRLSIDVITERTSERVHTIVFRHLESASTAIVQSNIIQRDPFFDAIFGNEDNDPLEERFPLLPGESNIPSRVTEVLNDFRAEDDECYTIGIFTTDVGGARELFDCNDDADMADNYFCLHTICITNDDEPFVVAFVQTTYTVLESEGPVEVCVNLTRPPVDILEETVRVRVTNDEDSIYIPDGVRLATPDTPDFLSRYLMPERTDYAEQTFGVNAINDELINATVRIICYDQPIYDDERLEVSEYAGLTLDVDDVFTTVLTLVQDLYDFASIRILDDDRARVGLERTFYSVSEGVGVVELCAVVYEPDIVCPIEFPFDVSLSTDDGTAVDTMDYGELDMILQFDTCDVRQCTFVSIVNDLVDEPEELFSYTLERTPGLDGRIDLDPTMGRVVIIDDDAGTQPRVNDTLTGDPLMTVPIFTDSSVMPGDNVPSLCYEVHGDANAYFNLISDECTSVSAFYQTASTASPNIDLNVVTQIGVRAVGNNGDRCYNIQVNLDGACSATVNGDPATNNTFDGITVRQYPRSRRVRISVPNCADTMLVMWVFCRDGEVEDPVTWVYFDVSFIRYVVMRGLNLNEKSHGLIGQFWNVPVTVEPYDGAFNEEQRSDDYMITVKHPDSAERSFVGLKADVTWEFESRVCYYVGNRQGGKLAEVTEPNESVIEGEYTQYKVDTLFSTNFTYTHFNANRC